MAQQMQQEGTIATNPIAVSAALQHPALSTEIRDLCAAACTCKAWREVVQQCKANTAIVVCLDAPLERLRGFAQWLPKHAMLVKSITVSSPPCYSEPKQVNGLEWRLHLEAAHALLQQALQLTTALPAAAAALAAGSSWHNTATMPQQQQQQPVRLPHLDQDSARSLQLQQQQRQAVNAGCTAAAAAAADDDMTAEEFDALVSQAEQQAQQQAGRRQPPAGRATPAKHSLRPGAANPQDRSGPRGASAAGVSRAIAAAVDSDGEQPSKRQRVGAGSSHSGMDVAISSVTIAGTTGMLAALPANRLTHLCITALQQPIDGGAVSAALARLSNLKVLQLNDEDRTASCGCLAVLSQLTQLTLLELGSKYEGSLTQSALQQLAAQALPLRVFRIYHASFPARLDVSHWTQLQEFRASCGNGRFDIILPPQLQKLEFCQLADEAGFEVIVQLQQLRCLAFADFECRPELLLRLAQMPALQQLSLRYSYNHAVPSTAAAWPRLPQLRKLVLEDENFAGEKPSRQQWQAICRGLAAATSLTELRLNEMAMRLEDEEWRGHEDDEVPVQLCANLTRLTNLKALSVTSSPLAPGDALALTALTGLTRLVLAGVGAGVGHRAAVGIAMRCQQLQHLDLSSCDLGSMACLGQLTQLTALHLSGSSGLTRQGLMRPTGLTRLQQLGVTTNSQVTEQVVQSFWTAVRQQQQQQQYGTEPKELVVLEW